MPSDTVSIPQQLDPKVFFAELTNLDWEDIESVHAVTSRLLTELAGRRALLLSMIDNVSQDPSLFARSESDGVLNKLVLYENSERSFSVRLHTLVSEEYDRPHDHRATFSALILRGSYLHTIYNIPASYAQDDERGQPTLAAEFLKHLKPVVTRREIVGNVYTLHHSAFHSTIADQSHLSLVIRGPSVKERLLFIDERKGNTRWYYGSAFETEQELTAVRMTVETLKTMRDKIVAL